MQVLRLPAVCSKRFLTTKVDRCVTGDRALTCSWVIVYILHSPRWPACFEMNGWVFSQ